MVTLAFRKAEYPPIPKSIMKLKPKIFPTGVFFFFKFCDIENFGKNPKRIYTRKKKKSQKMGFFGSKKRQNL
jgi:hypothetical protein